MSAPPKVFISAASGDLRSVRQMASKALLTIGCHPVEQSHFEPDYRTVRDMLRGRIEECQALVHIVGLCYGAEPDPASLPEGTPRRSYTQMEYDLGRALQKQRGGEWFRVYTFVCPEGFPYDPEPDAETEERRALQRAHRQAILGGEILYEIPADPAALETRIHALREEALRLRAERDRHQRRMLVVGLTILLTLLGIGAGVYWYVPDRIEQKVDQVFVADPVILRARFAEQLEKSFQAKLAELKAQAALPADIDQLYRLRDAQALRLDEAVRFIQASADESRSSLVKQAAQILQERGVDAALEFLEKNRAERGRRVREEARELAEAALFEAELHTGKLEFEPAIKAVRAAIEFDYRWWKPHNRLGLLNLELAQWDEAEREFKEAERFVGREEDRAAVLNNLATLLQATNRLGEVEPLMKRALAIDERSYGPEHPNVAIDLNNLAQLLQATNRLGEAEPLMKRALAIDERSYGPEHPNVARDLNNLASLLLATNRLGEAEPLMKRALAIDERSYGPEHPNVAIDLNNLAQLLQDTNRLGETEPLMKRALVIFLKFTRATGHEHPELRKVFGNYKRLIKAQHLTEAQTQTRLAGLGPEAGYGADEWRRLLSGL